jgi:hypothetical protein
MPISRASSAWMKYRPRVFRNVNLNPFARISIHPLKVNRLVENLRQDFQLTIDGSLSQPISTTSNGFPTDGFKGFDHLRCNFIQPLRTELLD